MSGPTKPNRTLDDGTPCWCVDQPYKIVGGPAEHTPRCLTQRALDGGHDFAPDPPTGRRGTGAGAKHSQRAKKALFLDNFRQWGVIQTACEAADVHRTTIFRWKQEDSAFEREFAAAYDSAIDQLEREAIRRAFEGWDEPVFQGGQHVGMIRKFSDTLLIFMMKGARPAKFRDNARLELTGADGGPIQSEAVGSLDDHEKATLRKLIDDALAQQEALDKA